MEGHAQRSDSICRPALPVDSRPEPEPEPVAVAVQGSTPDLEPQAPSTSMPSVSLTSEPCPVSLDLWDAAAAGDLVLARQAIDGGADTNYAAAKEGAMCRAQGRGDSTLMVASRNGHDSVVEHLLEAGADPRQAKEGGCTALYLASQEGHGTVVARLLLAGADPARTATTPWSHNF